MLFLFFSPAEVLLADTDPGRGRGPEHGHDTGRHRGVRRVPARCARQWRRHARLGPVPRLRPPRPPLHLVPERHHGLRRDASRGAGDPERAIAGTATRRRSRPSIPARCSRCSGAPGRSGRRRTSRTSALTPCAATSSRSNPYELALGHRDRPRAQPAARRPRVRLAPVDRRPVVRLRQRARDRVETEPGRHPNAADFLRRNATPAAAEGGRLDPVELFQAFIGSIHGPARPALWYGHFHFPHRAYKRLPDRRALRRPADLARPARPRPDLRERPGVPGDALPAAGRVRGPARRRPARPARARTHARPHDARRDGRPRAELPGPDRRPRPAGTHEGEPGRGAARPAVREVPRPVRREGRPAVRRDHRRAADHRRRARRRAPVRLEVRRRLAAGAAARSDAADQVLRATRSAEFLRGARAARMGRWLREQMVGPGRGLERLLPARARTARSWAGRSPTSRPPANSTAPPPGSPPPAPTATWTSASGRLPAMLRARLSGVRRGLRRGGAQRDDRRARTDVPRQRSAPGRRRCSIPAYFRDGRNTVDALPGLRAIRQPRRSSCIGPRLPDPTPASAGSADTVARRCARSGGRRSRASRPARSGSRSPPSRSCSAWRSSPASTCSPTRCGSRSTSRSRRPASASISWCGTRARSRATGRAGTARSSPSPRSTQVRSLPGVRGRRRVRAGLRAVRRRGRRHGGERGCADGRDLVGRPRPASARCASPTGRAPVRDGEVAMDDATARAAGVPGRRRRRACCCSGRSATSGWSACSRSASAPISVR